MKNSSVKKVLKRLKPYRFILLLAVLSALVGVSLTLYIPVLVGNAIDRIIGKGSVDFEDVARILGCIGIAIGGVTVCQWLMNYLVNLVSFRTVRDLRRDVFAKVMSFSPAEVNRFSQSSLITRCTNDVQQIQNMIVIMLPLFFLAMYERDGQPLEVIARHFIETKFIRPKIRPYRTDNYYRTLERQAWAEEEVAKIVRRHQETAEKPVRKKGTGAKHKAAGKPHKA